MRLFPFLARRAVQLVGVLTGICVVTFLLLHMAPGDPARLLVGERASAETIAAIREQYGLDQPLWRQFADLCRQPRCTAISACRSASSGR